MAGFAPPPFNPMLAESEFAHRASVDQLKWQLGQPVPSWPYCPLDVPYAYHPGYYDYYYYYDYPSGPGYQYHYSRGFRDGLSASRRSNSSGASSPAAAAAVRCESPASAKAAAAAASGQKSPASDDLMAFPSAGYWRPMFSRPISTATSYDDLAPLAWPFGCKPFYYRRADPPSVRYC